MIVLTLGLMVGVPLSTATAQVEFTLTNGSAVEGQTAARLQDLLERYDVTPWLLTARVLIDEQSIPHSHPVLTLHTRHLERDDLLLSTFVHEQLHWWFEGRRAQTAAAIAALEARFPRIAVGGRDGAADERSSYLHLLVNYLEYQAVKVLLGMQAAANVMAYWAQDHYRELYKMVLAEEAFLGDLVDRHALRCGAALVQTGPAGTVR
jgi:hypothetical protein